METDYLFDILLFSKNKWYHIRDNIYQNRFQLLKEFNNNYLDAYKDTKFHPYNIRIIGGGLGNINPRYILDYGIVGYRNSKFEKIKKTKNKNSYTKLFDKMKETQLNLRNWSDQFDP